MADKRRKKSIRRLLTLHRTLGLISAVFVLCLSVTGVMLQHTTGLGLDSRFLRADFWLSLYGFEPPSVQSAYEAEGHIAAHLGDRVYFNQRLLAEGVQRLVGMVKSNQIIVVAETGSLFLITETGELVERLTAVHGIPVPVSRLGLLASGEVVLASAGVQSAMDLETLALRHVPQEALPAPAWSDPANLTTTQVTEFQTLYADQLISLERLILDLHSGRLIGDSGVLLMDLMALLFIVMAISGIWIWSRRRRRHH